MKTPEEILSRGTVCFVNCTGFNDAVDALKKHQEIINRLTYALEAIVSPIKYLDDEAIKEGGKLDAMAALSIIKNPAFYQDIARRALENGYKASFIGTEGQGYVKCKCGGYCRNHCSE